MRRLIYTTNAIENYNRQIRKVTKTKAAFPTVEAAHKLLFLTNRRVTAKWTPGSGLDHYLESTGYTV